MHHVVKQRKQQEYESSACASAWEPAPIWCLRRCSPPPVRVGGKEKGFAGFHPDAPEDCLEAQLSGHPVDVVVIADGDATTGDENLAVAAGEKTFRGAQQAFLIVLRMRRASDLGAGLGEEATGQRQVAVVDGASLRCGTGSSCRCRCG